VTTIGAMRIARLARTWLSLSLLAAAAAAQWQPGPLRVGFSSHWSLDPARTYDTTYADGSSYAGGEPAPRPILVCVWYPAAAAPDTAPLRRGGYLELPPGDGRLAPFARALQAYARGIVAGELLDDEPDAAAEAALAALLAEPAAAVRDAPPAGGRYPLVLYHAGYGSSYEDNALFAERLASHGYVVAGSAYQQADGASFNIDAHDGSLRDLDALVRELSARPDVDASHLALAGHSGGAQTAFRAQARPQSAFDALIILDTTQDYWAASNPRWTHPPDALAAPERFRAPMLVTTGREATFDLVDRLSAADRWYLTFRELGHNEFIEQGQQTAELAARRAGPEAATTAQAARTAREGYDRVCSVALLFLDANLKRDAAAAAALQALAAASRPGDVACRLEHVPPGTTGPEPWDPSSAAPPEPRQLRGALAALGAPALLERLTAWHASQPQLPIFGLTFGMSLCSELIAAGRLDEARVLAPFYGRVQPDAAGVMLWIVSLSRTPADEAWKGHMLQAAALMAPDDAEVQAAWEDWQKR
jgi:Chlorophyllase enzyme